MRALILLLLPALAWSDLDITRRGYITVFDSAGVQVSRHTDIKEAYESISRQPAGTYRIVRPEEVVVLTLRDGGQPAEPIDLSYTSTAPSGDSVHVGAAPGSRVEVRYGDGTRHEVRSNGAVSCVGAQCSIDIRVAGGAWETWRW